MKTFTPGQRVLQLPRDTSDQSAVPSGTAGTIACHDPDQCIVVIDWDNGTRQSIDAGARTGIVALTCTWVPAAGTGLSWEQALGAVRAAGAAAGRDAAQWWCRDTLDARPTGEARSWACATLQALTGGDPTRINGLPLYDAPHDFAEPPNNEDLVALTVGPNPNPWPDLHAGQWEQAVDTYRDSYDQALLEKVREQCRNLLNPTGDDRDLSHLHPDGISIGRAGVFSGDWHLTDDEHPDRYRVGYAGVLIDRWNGWAVFSCTREVAETIVADQQHDRDRYRTELRGQGTVGPDLDHAVDEAYPPLCFDGDTIVADQRRLYDDPQAIDRIVPDSDGSYVVMGWNWCWEAVNPMRCERIAGELPAPGEEQRYVLLRHTPGMRVPHARLRATGFQPRTVPAGSGFTASLTRDDTVVATISDEGTGGATTLHALAGGFGSADMAAFTAGSRHHGRPVSQARLLDALATEAMLDEAITRAVIDSAGLLRLIDDAERTVTLRPVVPAPRSWNALRALGESLTPRADTGNCWQYWTGHRWQPLPGSTVTAP